jgi:hypothetical protein
MAKSPDPPWNNFFANVGKQGDVYNNPLSPSDLYWAFLSSCEQDEDTGLYYPMFEVVPSEWMNNVYLNPPLVSSPPPPAPALCFQIDGIQTGALLTALGLKSEDNLAEGSWYVLKLIKGAGPVTGNLYNPDIDSQPDQ